MNSISFTDLNLLPEIQRALAAVNYTTPTPIQAQTIPHLLERKDVFGCAQTGTGKTAAFALPILHRLGSQHRRAVPNAPRVLVLAPTRELAAQIGESFEVYGRHLQLRQTVIYGGVGQGRQVRALVRGVHILVATPGRLLDLMNQGHIRLDNLDVFVLDEADRMLDMGFLPDLKRIIAKLPEQRHSLFFSATLPEKVGELADTLLRDPVRIEVTPQSTTVESIEQKVMFVPQREKRDLLDKILQESGVGRVLVFTRTKHGADNLAKQLVRGGVKADSIHGNKSQNARTRTLEQFRSDRVQVLVATDLAARGIDVDGVTHVINFDLPQEPENYVHRIGRTGRAGASGIAYTLCDASERGKLREIERLIKQSLNVHEDHRDPHATERSEGQPRRRPSRGRPSGPRSGAGGGRPSGSGRPRRPGQRNFRSKKASSRSDSKPS